MTNEPTFDVLDVCLTLAAQHCLRDHDYRGTERFINQALAVNPTSRAALNARGLLLIGTGREPETLDPNRQIIALSPDHTSAYCKLAEARLYGGRLEDARTLCQQLSACAGCASPRRRWPPNQKAGEPARVRRRRLLLITIYSL